MKQNEGFPVELVMDLSSAKSTLELHMASHLLPSSVLNIEFITYQVSDKYGTQTISPYFSRTKE